MTIIASRFDRRHFIGGYDTRVIVGQNEKALIRLWQENAARSGWLLQSPTAPAHQVRYLLATGFPSEPHACTAALFDEVDSGLPKSSLDFLSSVGATAQKTIMGLKPLDRGNETPAAAADRSCDQARSA
jgi:hypothetical protein